MFQGPPLSLLHHITALEESDSKRRHIDLTWAAMNRDGYGSVNSKNFDTIYLHEGQWRI